MTGRHARAYFLAREGLDEAGMAAAREALAAYGHAVRLRPDYAEAYNNRGNVRSNLGQFEDALADYDRAIQLKPELVDALLSGDFRPIYLEETAAAPVG